MHRPYENMMEQPGEQEYETTKDAVGCCTCPTDSLACALNRAQQGRKASNVMMNSADARVAICQAAEHIRSSPHHEKIQAAAWIFLCLRGYFVAKAVRKKSVNALSSASCST